MNKRMIKRLMNFNSIPNKEYFISDQTIYFYDNYKDYKDSFVIKVPIDSENLFRYLKISFTNLKLNNEFKELIIKGELTNE